MKMFHICLNEPEQMLIKKKKKDAKHNPGNQNWITDVIFKVLSNSQCFTGFYDAAREDW